MAIELPTTKTPPSLSPLNSNILIYGAKGIGKTTLAADFAPDHTLLIATEPGFKHLEARVQEVGSWKEFREVCQLIAQGENDIECVAIDTIDELHRMCSDEVCKGLGIKHPSQGEFGLGWSAVRDEFALRIGKLCNLGRAIIFVSHEKPQEIKTKVGTRDRFGPSLSNAPAQWLEGLVDYIFRAEIVEEDGVEQRILRTNPSENWSAKQRDIEGGTPIPDPLPLNAELLRGALSDVAPRQPKQDALPIEQPVAA